MFWWLYLATTAMLFRIPIAVYLDDNFCLTDFPRWNGESCAATVTYERHEMRAFSMFVARLFVLAAVALPSFAGYTVKSLITELTVVSGIVFVNVNSDPTVDVPFPACATNTRYAFDARTPEGKAYYTALIMAYSLNVPVQIYGSGTCGTEATSETLTAVLTLLAWK